MLVARGLAVALVAALALALAPGADWAFQIVYPLALALGAASLGWRPVLLLLALPLWAALDYAIEPYDDPAVGSSTDAAVSALVGAVPIALIAFAVGKALRAFAVALGARNVSSS